MPRLFFRVYAGIALCACVSASAQTKRALLIGIDHYRAPEGAAVSVPPAGHAPDSRFDGKANWVNLGGPLIDVADMTVLLTEQYGFSDVRILKEGEATRQGILDAIDKLIADSKAGDLVVFYFAGHGSLRRDTRSSKNNLDETIVPADAWKGVADIRDKELAVRFNQIVYDKQARLVAIYDSCHSGTMARGVTNSVQRALPYDDRDVAQEPGAITEADLKRIPQKGNSIIIAAAASTESAAEAQYPDDGEHHGAFTRALVRVLRTNTQPLSAADVIAQISSLLHADPVPFQQPSVEGRVDETLFGEPLAEHRLHAHVQSVKSGVIVLDVGKAGGFDIGTQFTAVDSAGAAGKTVIEVTSVDEALLAKARIIGGDSAVHVGQTFELSKMTYPQAARLSIYISTEKGVPAAAEVARVKILFPSLTWVADPALSPIQYLVLQKAGGWAAIGQDGKPHLPSSKPHGAAFLLLSPPPALVQRIRASEPFQRGAFEFTGDLTAANYLFAARPRPDGTLEYALFDPFILSPHPSAKLVESSENDPEDTDLNGGVAPNVVCRNDVSLPVRTAWLRASSGAAEDSVAPAFDRRIVRLGKLRVWMQSPSLAPGAGGWPYQLEIVRPGTDQRLGDTPLGPNEAYDVRLTATPERMASRATVPKYIYLFGFDCSGNPFLLYPNQTTNGDATFPQPGADGVYPLKSIVVSESVGTPLGADTIFLLATKQKITDLSLLTNDGVLERSSRGAGNGFEQLVGNMNDAATRGPNEVPTNWLVQQLVIPSRQ